MSATLHHDETYFGFKDADGSPSAPLPKQQEALDLIGFIKHMLLEGSLGWGKTDLLVLLCIDEALKYQGNQVLLGRKHLGSLRKSTLMSLYELLPAELILSENQQKQEIKLINKSVIHYMQLDGSREATKKLQSINFGAAFIDQLEEITREVFLAVKGRIRRKRASRVTVSTCNPEGHNWIWQDWINEVKKGYGYVSGRMWPENVGPPTCQEDVTPLRCDNPYLPWDYIADLLENYPEKWVKRFIFGGWDNFEGLVWPDFHRRPFDPKNVTHGQVVKPRMIMPWWNRYMILDHGHRNPTGVLFGAVDGDGVLWLYDCYYDAGHWVDYHAGNLLKMMGKYNYYGQIADPSIFHERDSDVTIADRYASHGIYFERANNDKAGGIDNVGQMLSEGRIRVFDMKCFDPFWEEIGAYVWKDLKPGSNDPEEPIKKNDHLCDALRYIGNHLQESPMPKKPNNDGWGSMFSRRKNSKSWMST